jgi:hypothetical protein
MHEYGQIANKYFPKHQEVVRKACFESFKTCIWVFKVVVLHTCGRLPVPGFVPSPFDDIRIEILLSVSQEEALENIMHFSILKLRLLGSINRDLVSLFFVL